MRLHYRVQHVEGRDAPLARLLGRLPPAVEVIAASKQEAQAKNPLKNYMRCITDPPKGVTHLVILQDDVLPCNRFDAVLKMKIKERPDDMISLFVGGLPGRTRTSFYQALKDGSSWSPIYFREIHHVVALVWPVKKAKEFFFFMETAKLPGAVIPRSDDAAVGFWARKTKTTFWATVPCLVQHPDDFPSICHSVGRQGDPGRKAIHWEE